MNDYKIESQFLHYFRNALTKTFCEMIKVKQGQLTHRKKVINMLKILVQKSERTKDNMEPKNE